MMTQALLPRLPLLFGSALCAVLLAISIADLVYRRVGNLLVVGCLLWGIVAHAVVMGPAGALGSLLLGLGMLVLTLPLYAFDLVGAADVKLIAALSSCAGLSALGPFIAYTAVVAGVLGFGRVASEVRLLGPQMWLAGLMDGSRAMDRARRHKTTLPLAVALSIGLGMALVLERR